MNLLNKINKKLVENDLDIPSFIAIIGIFLTPVFYYSFVITIIACLFMKDDNSESEKRILNKE